MAVGAEDVRHIASLARLGVPEERVATLVAELNGILAHMDVLQQVDTTMVQPVVVGVDGGEALRVDEGVQMPLARPRDAFAPAMRDGFFLVPRLHTHDALGAAANADGAPDEE